MHAQEIGAARAKAAAEAAARAEREAGLRAELVELKLSQLKKRARAEVCRAYSRVGCWERAGRC